jgi:hypothetical protein
MLGATTGDMDREGPSKTFDASQFGIPVDTPMSGNWQRDLGFTAQSSILVTRCQSRQKTLNIGFFKMSRRITAVWVEAAACVSLCGSVSLGDEAQPRLDEILTAWRTRAMSRQSIEYAGALQQYEHIGYGTAGNPFGETKRSTQVQLERSFVVKWKAARLFYSLKGDWWPTKENGDVIPDCSIAGTSDCREYRELSTFPSQFTPYTGRFGVCPKRDHSVLQRIETMPVWLWHNPVEFLESIGYRKPIMEVVESTSATDADGLVILSVRQGKHPVGAKIHVEQMPPFLPRTLVLLSNGRPNQRITLFPGAVGELSEWKYTSFNSKGGVHCVIHGTVSQVTQNDVDDSDFVIPFPVGTQITETTEKQNELKHWKQVTETEMTPIAGR